MTINPAKVSEESTDRHRPSMVEMIDRLSRFDGPPEQFLVNLLAVQCHLAAADGGSIMRISPQHGVEILAVYPQPAPGSTAPVWLAQAAESAADVVRGGRTTLKPLHGPDDLYGQPASQHLIMLPLRGGSGVLGLAGFVVRTGDHQVLAATQQRLELTVSLLSLYEMRLTLQQRQADLSRLRLAMETTAAVNEPERFAGAAMALCNEVASRWTCDRAALGFLKGRYVHLKAMSHTEKFSRKMKLVQDLEAAMEEALDQDVEVLYPPPQGATFVSRAAGELSKQHGPAAMLSLPLRRGGQVAAVLTLERPAEETFALEEVETLRLTCDLCTPRLVAMHETDRWFGARAAAAVRKGLAALVGPKHTWIKVAAIAICAVIAFLVFAKGQFRAEAPFVFEANTLQVVPAPFDGFLKSAYVRPGDVVAGAREERPSWQLGPQDIADWAGLLAELRAQKASEAPTPAKQVWALLTDEARRAIEGAATAAADPNAPAGPGESARQAILAAINAAMESPALYEEQAWRGLKGGKRQEELLETLKAGTLPRERLIELNRSLLAATFPGRIAPGPTVLATLETIELRLELKASEAERLGYLKQAAAAMREDKRAEAQVAQAQADEVTAKIRLLEHRIARAVLVSPIDGCIVEVSGGDLLRQLGAPAKTGDVLLKVASLADLRAELSMPEDLIADVQAALERQARDGRPLGGELATNARPDQHIGFTVERINPIAEVVEQSNVFKVRAQLAQRPAWLRPGMEGVGKIDVDRRSYGYIWTRRLINWIRMKLWW